MRYLADDRHPITVHGTAEFFEIRDHAVIEDLDTIPVACRAVRMNACTAEAHHEPDAAFRFILVIAAFDIVRHTVPGKRIRMRAAADTIF